MARGTTLPSLEEIGVIYEFDTCVLDTAKQQLWRDGQPVHAEPQVLAVLELLARNRERVVPKIELLDEVWGDRFVSESALTSRIKWARKACGDSGAEQRIIRTLHGRGYRFVADVHEAESTGYPEDADVAAPAAEPIGPQPFQPTGTRSPQGAAGPAIGAAARRTGIVGRDRELAVLDDALREALNGSRRTIFVTGEIGSGTSTLVSEFVERSDALDGWAVLRSQCLRTRGAVEPYFCILDGLTRLAQLEPQVVRSTLFRVAPTWLSQLPSIADAETQRQLEPRLLGFTPQRMLREGVEAIQELARTRPLLLILDGLQWADDCTLDVLDHLMRRTESLPLLVLATARTEPAPVNGLIAQAVGAGLADELRLSGLERDAIEALLRERLGGAEPPAALIDVVAERAGGVPLFAQEMITAWLRSGLVEVRAGSVSLNAPADMISRTLPASLPPLIEQALASLDPGDVAVLESAAMAGQVFSGAEVAAGLGRPVVEVEARLSALARQVGYVEALGRTSWPDGTVSTQYTFTHRLYRDVVHDRSAEASRALTHAAIGAALETGFGTRASELAVTLADHFVQAGDDVRAVEYLRMAGEQAVSRGAHAQAAEFLREALDRCRALPPGQERELAELRVRVALGPALVATLGWFDPQVRQDYEDALALSERVGPGPETAAARYGMATVTELSGQFARTEELLLPLVEPGRPGGLSMEAHELLACSAFHQGAFDRSVANAEAVLQSWDEDTYSVLMSRIAEHPASSCSSWWSLAAWALGDSDGSLERAERAVALGERNPYALSTALQQRAMLHQLRREPEECIRWSERTREVGGQQDFPMRIIQADIYKGWALGVSGSAEEGMRLVADGIERFRATGATLNAAYYLALHAETVLNAGRPHDALRLLDEALVVMHAATRSYFYEPEIHRLRAAALLATGAPDDQVRESLETSSSLARASGSPILVVRALLDRVTLEAEHGDPSPWLAELAELIAQFPDDDSTREVAEARSLLTA